MENVTIELADGTFEGNVYISSTSKFSAWRVPRSSFNEHSELLNKNGLYIFLMDQKEMYVGETRNLYQRNRSTSSHRENLDLRWETLIVFPCSASLSDNQLEFIENALCEYLYPFARNGQTCLTNKKPKQENCNKEYRNSNYELSPVQIRTCNQYVEDILHYISLLRDPHFKTCAVTASMRYSVTENPCSTRKEKHCVKTPAPVETIESTPQTVEPEEIEWHEFYYPASNRNRSRVHGKVLIQFTNGKHGKAILKKNAVVSDHEAKDCGDPAQRARACAIQKGKLVDWILQEDIELDNANIAIRFLTGNSASAPGCWISNENGKKLKDF